MSHNSDSFRCWSCGSIAIPNTICHACGKPSSAGVQPARGGFDHSALLTAQRSDMLQPPQQLGQQMPQYGTQRPPLMQSPQPQVQQGQQPLIQPQLQQGRPPLMQPPQQIGQGPQMMQTPQQQFGLPPQMMQSPQQQFVQPPPPTMPHQQQYGQHPHYAGASDHSYGRQRFRRQRSPTTHRRKCVTCEYMKDCRSRYAQCHQRATDMVPLPRGMSKFVDGNGQPQQQQEPIFLAAQEAQYAEIRNQAGITQFGSPFEQHNAEEAFRAAQVLPGGSSIQTGDMSKQEPGSDQKSSIPATQRSSRSVSVSPSPRSSSAVSGSFGSATPGRRATSNSSRSISPTQPIGGCGSHPFEGHFTANAVQFGNGALKKEPFDTSQPSPTTGFGNSASRVGLDQMNGSVFPLVSHGGYEYKRVKLHIPRVIDQSTFSGQADWILNHAWDFQKTPFYGSIEQKPLHNATSLPWLDGYAQEYSQHMAKCEQNAIAAMAHKARCTPAYLELQALRNKVAAKLGEDNFDPENTVRFPQEKLPLCVGNVHNKILESIRAIQQIRPSTLPPTPEGVEPSPSPIKKPEEVAINDSSSQFDITGDMKDTSVQFEGDAFFEDSEDVYRKSNTNPSSRDEMLKAFSAPVEEETPVLTSPGLPSLIQNVNAEVGSPACDMDGVRDQIPQFEYSKDDKKRRKKVAAKETARLKEANVAAKSGNPGSHPHKKPAGK